MSLGDFFYYAFLGLIGGELARYIYFNHIRKNDRDK